MFVYDALGRAQKVQYLDGREVSYTYGKAGERYCWNNSLIYVDYNGEFPTIIAGAIIGGVVSFASSIVTQVVIDRKMNWKEVAVDTIGGAIKGGIAGSGIGIVGGILATGATGAATSVASQIYADDKKLNEVDWSSVVIAGGIDAVTYGVGKYKIKGKGPTVQEQLEKQMMCIRRDYIRWDMTKNGSMEKVINVQ